MVGRERRRLRFAGLDQALDDNAGVTRDEVEVPVGVNEDRLVALRARREKRVGEGNSDSRSTQIKGEARRARPIHRVDGQSMQSRQPRAQTLKLGDISGAAEQLQLGQTAGGDDVKIEQLAESTR